MKYEENHPSDFLPSKKMKSMNETFQGLKNSENLKSLHKVGFLKL